MKLLLLLSLTNSRSIGRDGMYLDIIKALHQDIIKANISIISYQLTYIFNLSFSQGNFPRLLK